MELTDQVRRQIGQHFVVGFHGHDVSPNIEVLIRHYHVGHPNAIRAQCTPLGAKQVHALLRKLQQIAKDAGHERPLMIGIDQENGLVSAFTVAQSNVAGTQFPGAMALAASGSPDLAERTSEASARELKFVGINWAYSPVADVNSDPRNPVIGVRSFGDVPEEVAKYVAAVSRGLTKAGVASSPKHFPGHGDTHVDSHLSLPVIPKTSLLYPKRISCPSEQRHMALPAVTGDTTPASLSRGIIKELLRGTLGYGGVVVTDCLEMEAVAAREGGVPAAAVDALRAGADIAMICHHFGRQRDAFEAAYSALRSGTLDLRQLHTFAGDWAHVLGAPFDEAQWSRLKAENAPLSGPSRGGVAVVVLTPRMGPSYLTFATGIGERVNGASLHSAYSPEVPLGADVRDAIGRAAASSSISVLFVTRDADRSPSQLDRLREHRVVVLASCGPYDLLRAAPRFEGLGLEEAAYVACFEFTAEALEAAAAVIFGEEEASGRVPVCGGDVFPVP
ncbi:glycoside hydrolase superfamily [Russula brevipes]|nr:glycoside hydrolase superfamily [Russula brevipes]